MRKGFEQVAEVTMNEQAEFENRLTRVREAMRDKGCKLCWFTIPGGIISCA